jgi:hypothetical protein
MKKKLGLFAISRERMKYTKGSEGDCLCTCIYAGKTGSAFVDNADANILGDLKTPTFVDCPQE